ncbi:MAG: hypothetical protein NTU69_05005 [Proteobacteria bacterium]|jgi:hypothetical protein|nr:hypothetical protein [Pseudomonadota bacterium]
MADYSYEEKENFEGKKVRVLGPTYEEGKPESSGNWKEKLGTRDDAMNYLRTALRYWYSKDWYGSEKRKQEA